MTEPRIRVRASAILSIVLLVSGCAATVGSPVASASGPAPSGTAAAPTTTAPAASATTGQASATTAQPPPASLAVEGGDPVVGQLGSYTWAGGGSDSPWLPGAPLRVGVGERLALTLADGTGVGAWSARRVPAASTDGSGAVALGRGTTGPVAFDAPERGSWSVQVTIRFAGDLGSANYYWQVSVT